MSFPCPACHRNVYSLRKKNCGYCGAEIPASAMFSLEKSRHITRSIEEIETRRQRDKAEEEEKAAEAALRNPSVMLPPTDL